MVAVPICICAIGMGKPTSRFIWGRLTREKGDRPSASSSFKALDGCAKLSPVCEELLVYTRPIADPAKPKTQLSRLPLRSRPPAQLTGYEKEQQAEARAIAQRFQNNPHSERLERLLRRQQTQTLGVLLEERQRQIRLVHLAIARLPDDYYGLTVRGTNRLFCEQVFETPKYCAEAAAELEQTFALDWRMGLLSGEAMEMAQAIIQAHVWREWVAMEMEGAKAPHQESALA
ncbi:MAG: hypothetical protein WCD18_15030 [Thermosynechococcaceae cyanobacterium]